MRGRNWAKVIVVGVVYSVMTTVGVLWVIARDGRASFWHIAANDIWSSLGLGVGLATAVLWLSGWAASHTNWGRTLDAFFAQVFGGFTILHCIATALASGVGEEMLFRAALQPSAIALAARGVGGGFFAGLLGILLTSLAFAAVHMPFRRELAPWTVFAFGTSVAFGAIYAWTDNIVGPMLAHALINGVNLARIARKGAPAGPKLTIHEKGGMLEFERR